MPLPAQRMPPEHLNAAIRFADKYQVPRNVFLGLLEQESSFDPNAVSRTGARGYGQLFPAAAQDAGFDYEQVSRDPVANLEASAKYLRHIRDRFVPQAPDADELDEVGAWRRTLQMYHTGPGNSAWGARPDPNDPESIDYVDKVVGRSRKYEDLSPILGGAATGTVRQAQSTASQANTQGQEEAISPDAISPDATPRFVTNPALREFLQARGYDPDNPESAMIAERMGLALGEQPSTGLGGDIAAAAKGFVGGFEQTGRGLLDLLPYVEVGPREQSPVEQVNPTAAAAGHLGSAIPQFMIPHLALGKLGAVQRLASASPRLARAAQSAGSFGAFEAAQPGDLEQRVERGAHGVKAGAILGLLGAPEGAGRLRAATQEGVAALAAFQGEPVLPGIEDQIPGPVQDVLFGAAAGLLGAGRPQRASSDPTAQLAQNYVQRRRGLDLDDITGRGQGIRNAFEPREADVKLRAREEAVEASGKVADDVEQVREEVKSPELDQTAENLAEARANAARESEGKMPLEISREPVEVDPLRRQISQTAAETIGGRRPGQPTERTRTAEPEYEFTEPRPEIEPPSQREILLRDMAERPTPNMRPQDAAARAEQLRQQRIARHEVRLREWERRRDRADRARRNERIRQEREAAERADESVYTEPQQATETAGKQRVARELEREPPAEATEAGALQQTQGYARVREPVRPTERPTPRRSRAEEESTLGREEPGPLERQFGEAGAAMDRRVSREQQAREQRAAQTPQQRRAGEQVPAEMSQRMPPGPYRVHQARDGMVVLDGNMQIAARLNEADLASISRAKNKAKAIERIVQRAARRKRLAGEVSEAGRARSALNVVRDVFGIRSSKNLRNLSPRELERVRAEIARDQRMAALAHRLLVNHLTRVEAGKKAAKTRARNVKRAEAELAEKLRDTLRNHLESTARGRRQLEEFRNKNTEEVLDTLRRHIRETEIEPAIQRGETRVVEPAGSVREVDALGREVRVDDAPTEPLILPPRELITKPEASGVRGAKPEEVARYGDKKASQRTHDIERGVEETLNTKGEFSREAATEARNREADRIVRPTEAEVKRFSDTRAKAERGTKEVQDALRRACWTARRQ